MTDILINTPDLWSVSLPLLKSDGHKYDRGHAVILGGPMASSGAARLASRAALRIGAGLVSLACDPSSLMIYALALEAVMTKPVKTVADYATLINDRRVSAMVLGPGAGLNDRTLDMVITSLATQKPCVLDADGLSVFAPDPKGLFKSINGPCILTPHEGEFQRLFGVITDRHLDAMRAAKASGAIIVLKGAETCIAAPDGRLIVNQAHAPQMATAGSGDVLAGIIGGLLAQGMTPFDAACAGVWIHAEAARTFGLGLIAEDLPDLIPAVLTGLAIYRVKSDT